MKKQTKLYFYSYGHHYYCIYSSSTNLYLVYVDWKWKSKKGWFFHFLCYKCFSSCSFINSYLSGNRIQEVLADFQKSVEKFQQALAKGGRQVIETALPNTDP